MRRLITFGLGTLCVLLAATQAQALIAVADCASDADCGDGSFCNLDDCADAAEDPSGDMPPCVGWCEPKGGDPQPPPNPWTPESECDTDADCAEGFECLEGSALIPQVDVPVEPTCPEGEKCGDEDSGGGSSEPSETDAPGADEPDEDPAPYIGAFHSTWEKR